MQNPCVYGVGGVVSADVAVPEHEREHAFYASILTTGDTPLWRESLTNNEGTPVIGLGERTLETDALPLQWMPHIQVADVAASVDRASELGGSILIHGKTEAGQSQWAVLVDPAGAAFGVVPVVSGGPDAAALSQHQGRIAGLTLTVPDALASRDFYEHVVGWRATTVEPGEADAVRVEMQSAEGTVAADLRQRRGAQQGLPPVWLIHLPVGDLAESLRRVVGGGGAIVEKTTHYAVIQDPVGVALALQGGEPTFGPS
ncbi:MAG: VOC family protein [Bacteroidota bacterium]